MYSISEWMQIINDKFGTYIEKHQGLRQIIDVQFVTTKRIYLMNFMIMLVGFDIPFVYQVNLGPESEYLYDQLNHCCLATCIWFLCLEYIQVRGMGRNYFKEIINLVDLVLYCLYFYFYHIRVGKHEVHLLIPQKIQETFPFYGRCEDGKTAKPPQSDDEIKKCQQFMKSNAYIEPENASILTFVIVLLCFIKTWLYLRVFPTFGQIMRLSFSVLFAANAFSLFFYMVISFFAFGYHILGNSVGGHEGGPDDGGGDYERLPYFIGLLLYSYRTAIGDLETPNALIWATIRNNDQKETLIVYIIWCIWMIEQYFILIVILNFLIAIIS